MMERRSCVYDGNGHFQIISHLSLSKCFWLFNLRLPSRGCSSPLIMCAMARSVALRRALETTGKVELLWYGFLTDCFVQPTILLLWWPSNSIRLAHMHAATMQRFPLPPRTTSLDPASSRQPLPPLHIRRAPVCFFSTFNFLLIHSIPPGSAHITTPPCSLLWRTGGLQM
jgi:hypothetical protein